MKKPLFAITLIFCAGVNASAPSMSDETKAYLIKQGLPIPGTGVTIAEPHRSLAANKSLEEQRKDGYRHEYSQAANNLLHIDELLKPEIRRVKALVRQKQSANISSNLSDITMAYPFKPVPFDSVKRVITYAPTGVYLNDGKNEGWVGLTEYFESNFAPCSYEEVSVPLTGTATIMDRDTVTYEVANKVGEYYATGDSTGYLYQIEWMDATFRRKLRCATKVFSSEMKPNLIALANRIDLG